MPTTIKDDRTPEQQDSHRFLVIMTDSFMSGWGHAEGGASYAAWACETQTEANEMFEKVSARSDALRVRQVYDAPHARYRPGQGCAHLHIYLAN